MASRLLIEPFCVGSHKQLIDLLQASIDGCDVFTLPGKKWHWKARTSALWLSQQIPRNHQYRVLFATSVLNLAELIALRPDLASLRKVLYFHENQLVYPVRDKKENRDFQFGYNQILSSMVADTVLFNSKFNMESFLGNINSFLKLIPDHRPKSIPEILKPKCHVLHFPIVFPDVKGHTGTDDGLCGESMNLTEEGATSPSIGTESQSDRKNESIDSNEDDVRKSAIGTVPLKKTMEYWENIQPNKRARTMLKDGPLHIVWPHRWEHDKDPDLFFRVLKQLHENSLEFQVSVLGEAYQDVPECFAQCLPVLGKKIIHWGYQPSKEAYYDILRSADCVVSTAKHEFFGVAMLEAVHLGCYPVCPNELVYPEIFPRDCLYNTEVQLYKKLSHMCKVPHRVRNMEVVIDTSKYSWDTLEAEFNKFLEVT